MATSFLFIPFYAAPAVDYSLMDVTGLIRCPYLYLDTFKNSYNPFAKPGYSNVIVNSSRHRDLLFEQIKSKIFALAQS